MYPSPSSDKLTTYPKYLLHKICENVESLAKSDELSKSNFLKGNQTIEEMIGRYVPPESGIFNDDPDEEFLKK